LIIELMEMKGGFVHGSTKTNPDKIINAF